MHNIIPIAYAAVDITKFGNTINPIISYIVNPIIMLMFAVATLVFTYGVLQMVFKGNDPEARETSKNSILYGVIGMFIMVSAWGIVMLISRTIAGI